MVYLTFQIFLSRFPSSVSAFSSFLIALVFIAFQLLSFLLFLFFFSTPRQTCFICLFSNCISQAKGITHSSLLLWPRLPVSQSLSITFHPITLPLHEPVCLSTHHGAKCLANCKFSANYNTRNVILSEKFNQSKYISNNKNEKQ